MLPTRPPKFVRVFFDGGLRDNMASYGYVLYAVLEDNHEGDVRWIKIAAYGELLGDVTIVQAELRGAIEAITAGFLYIRPSL